MPIIISTKDGHFIGPDNGVFTPVLENEDSLLEIREITNDAYFLDEVS